MRKFFAATIAAVVALLLLPTLLVRSDPLVGRASVPEGAEQVGARASFEPIATPSPKPEASPSPSMAALAPATPNALPTADDRSMPDGVDEEDGEDEETPPPGAVSVSRSMPQSDLSRAEEPDDRTVTTIRVLGEGEMALEDYVAGVVAAEMSPAFPTEARRAQAVAARSLALYRVGHPKHGDSAVCLSAGCCMAWKDPDDGALDAARSTEGVIATYDDEPIMAAFFAGCSGVTRSAEEVWGGSVPYLVSVSSPWETATSTRGHGVGMSQYGAAGMAEDGADYNEILQHYYTGIEVG